MSFSMVTNFGFNVFVVFRRCFRLLNWLVGSLINCTCIMLIQNVYGLWRGIGVA